MTRRLALVAALAAVGVTLTACDLSMTQQRKLKTYAPTALWPDGTSARPLPADVVAQGDVARRRRGKNAAAGHASTVARAARSAFGIFCAPCHGLAGDGDGIIVAHGFPAPPSYHIDRLLAAQAQHFYDVMTKGYGVMFSYADPRRPTRPLGDCRVYPCAAAVAPRHRRRSAGRRGAYPMNGRDHRRIDVRNAALVGARLGGRPADRRRLARAQGAAAGWLVGFAFWVQILVGSLSLIMIHRLTGGPLGRGCRAGDRTGIGRVPLLLVLAIPLFISIPTLYPWPHHPAFDQNRRAVLLSECAVVQSSAPCWH